MADFASEHFAREADEMKNSELQEMYENMDDETLLAQTFVRLVNTARVLKACGFEDEAKVNTILAKTLAKQFEF